MMTRAERSERMLAQYGQQDIDRYRDHSYDEVINLYGNAVVALHRAMILGDAHDSDVERLRDHAHMMQYVAYRRAQYEAR